MADSIKDKIVDGFFDGFASPFIRDKKAFGAAVLKELSEAKVDISGPIQGVGGVIQSLYLIGLMPSRQAGLVYAVTYKGKPQLMVGYKGFIELGWRSGYLARITPQVVLADEQCEWTETASGPIVRHAIPAKRKAVSPELVEFAYCSWTATNGTSNAVRAEGSFIRNLYAKADPKSPWKTGEDSLRAMIFKTPIRQAAKLWNMTDSPELAAALQVESLNEADERTIAEPSPENGTAARLAIETAGITRIDT